MVSCAHEMAPLPEVPVDHGMRGQEPLCVTARLESLHLPLSSSRGWMRILGAVVQVPALPMPDISYDGSVSDAVAAQAVPDEASWLVRQPVQQVFEETLGSGADPPVLNHNVQHDAVVIPHATDSAAHPECE
jgi:hypothetical protein